MGHRPHNVAVHGEDRVREAIRQRAPRPWMLSRVAADASVSLRFIYQVLRGDRRVSPKLAEKLGFKLAWVRADEVRDAE